jgi:hypothetical protein
LVAGFGKVIKDQLFSVRLGFGNDWIDCLGKSSRAELSRSATQQEAGARSYRIISKRPLVRPGPVCFRAFHARSISMKGKWRTHNAASTFGEGSGYGPRFPLSVSFGPKMIIGLDFVRTSPFRCMGTTLRRPKSIWNRASDQS